MVGFLVKGLGSLLHCLIGGVHHRQQFLETLVNVFFGHTALLHGLYKSQRTVWARDGHHQVGTVFHAQGMVIVCAPVGDHKAIKAPFGAEDFFQQMGIFIGVNAVNHIVGRHDGLGMSFLHGNLKAGKVDFPQGTLVHHGVHGHAAQLLGVDSEVLRAGGNAICLNTPDVGSRHFTGQIGVFGKILEVPPAQRTALHVQAGTKQNIHVIGGCFFAQGSAHFLTQGLIPGVRHGGSGGEAGGRDGGIQPQMVTGTGLLAQTVRAI